MNLQELSQIFGVKISWAYSRKKLKIITEMRDLTFYLNKFLIFLNGCRPRDEWFIRWQIEETEMRLTKLEKRKKFLNKLINDHRAQEAGLPARVKYESFDIEQIKRVPIDQIAKITRAGFFMQNPFRREHAPSDSLYWYKKVNRWHDFGTGDNGDVIDLYMKLYGCDFSTACRELSNLI